MGNDHNYVVYILAVFAFFFGIAFMSASVTGCAATRPEDEFLLEDVKVAQTNSEGSEGSAPGDKTGAAFSEPVLSEAASPEVTEDGQVQVCPATILVHVCGAVQNPGVYELEEGSRIYELLVRCGGYLPEADSLYLNQAQPLSDGEKIYVPVTGEIEAQPLTPGAGSAQSAPSAGGESDSRVNINTADEKELTTITGIGPSRAADIIAYRESCGAFAQTEDIMKVPGIKEGLFAKIKDSIRVR